MGGMGGGPMDFGKSKSKFQEIPETGVGFADVAVSRRAGRRIFLVSACCMRVLSRGYVCITCKRTQASSSNFRQLMLGGATPCEVPSVPPTSPWLPP